MDIRILAIGNKMPAWINAGFEEYAKRFPPSCSLQLIEIPAEKRTTPAESPRLIRREGEKMLNAIKPSHRVIALDVQGKMWSTEELSKKLASWLQEGRNIDLLIGGADGLAEDCKEKADILWSLSPLTLPHSIVRVVLAEQLYRALMILQGHPYHRA